MLKIKVLRVFKILRVYFQANSKDPYLDLGSLPNLLVGPGLAAFTVNSRYTKCGKNSSKGG